MEEVDLRWNSPINLVRKKDGKLRLTHNFRKINQTIEANNYLLPIISEEFKKLKEPRYFTKFE